MDNAETRLLQRYFRKTKAHPEGSVVHFGDCEFFSIRHCSCGLLVDLMPLSPEMIEQNYPLYCEELAEHEAVRNRLMQNIPSSILRKRKKRH